MSSRARTAFVVVVLATVTQLVAASTFAADLPQFSGKGFAARLAAYPAMMLLVPAVWWVKNRRRRSGPAPWTAFSLIALPFLVDVTGNTLDLYDSVVWFDDLLHFLNWFLLSCGAGLLLSRSGVRPVWALSLLVGGLGALLAVGWEVGEWYTFIRQGTELDTAYEDTLGDEVLGSVGALLAGLVVGVRERRRAAAPPGQAVGA